MTATDHTRPAAEANGSAAPERSLPETIAQRLDELRAELGEGRKRLQELDGERTRVLETVLRIEGAILALEELERSPAQA